MEGVYKTVFAFTLLVSCSIGLITAEETNLVQAEHASVRQLTAYDATLKCIILNKDATSISWTKKGQQVKADDRHTVTSTANSTTRSTSLRIKSIEQSDFGEYVCQASISNKIHSATIKLQEKKRDAIVRPLEKTIKQDLKSNATLKCHLPKEATNINWLKNGVIVKTDKRHEVLRSSTGKYRSTTLNIKSIEESDYGTYECTAKIAGTNQSAVIKLTDLKGAPPVEASYAEVKEALGSNVVLKCDLAKNPSSVSWSKNGAKLKSDEHRTIVHTKNKQNKFTSTTLNFKKLVADDFGTYQCEAVVSGKTYSASIKLIESK